MIVHKLLDSEDQAHSCGVIVVCGAYVSGADQCTEKPRSEEAACIGLLVGRGGFRSVKAGSDIHRDGAQFRDGVSLRKGELVIVGVDERDVEWIILCRGIVRRKQLGNLVGQPVSDS